MRMLAKAFVCLCVISMTPALSPVSAQTTVTKKNTGAAATTTTAPPTRKVAKPKKPNTDAVGVRPTTAIFLTEGQCKGLGGKVIATGSDSCAGTNKACYTTDQDGVIRSACITAN
jgi:hypothetical protein